MNENIFIFELCSVLHLAVPCIRQYIGNGFFYQWKATLDYREPKLVHVAICGYGITQQGE